MEYRVELDTYRGPLDLLLYLVKRNEVDICDIPIAAITAQYLEYLKLLRVVDVEQTADFLVMAGTLIEIKSRSLLPPGDSDEEAEDDPRTGLVKQLLEYKRFKELAAALERKAEQQSTRLARSAPPWPADSDDQALPVGRVEVWDLVSAFNRLVRETLPADVSEFIPDDIPIQAWIEELLTSLTARGGRASFQELFAPPHTRARLLGLFLALLDLMKSGQVAAEQPEPFGVIWVELLAAPTPSLAGAFPPTTGTAGDQSTPSAGSQRSQLVAQTS
jgi:segregation and condensation protein A